MRLKGWMVVILVLQLMICLGESFCLWCSGDLGWKGNGIR